MGKAATTQGHQPHNNTDMPATRTPANEVFALRKEMGTAPKRKRNANPTGNKAEATMSQQEALHLLEAIDPPLVDFPIIFLLVPNYLRMIIHLWPAIFPPNAQPPQSKMLQNLCGLLAHMCIINNWDTTKSQTPAEIAVTKRAKIVLDRFKDKLDTLSQYSDGTWSFNFEPQEHVHHVIKIIFPCHCAHRPEPQPSTITIHEISRALRNMRIALQTLPQATLPDLREFAYLAASVASKVLSLNEVTINDTRMIADIAIHMALDAFNAPSAEHTANMHDKLLTIITSCYLFDHFLPAYFETVMMPLVVEFEH